MAWLDERRRSREIAQPVAGHAASATA
jgi:hypothetical protein